MTKKLLGVAFLFFNVVAFSQTFKADDIIGTWKTGEATAKIKIYKTGNTYQGKIVWLKEPIDPQNGNPKVDKKNSDEKLKSRPIIGLVNTWAFAFKQPNIWDNGKIYDPNKGSTYSCNIKMITINTMKVRGYIGLSLFGRSDVWTRENE